MLNKQNKTSINRGDIFYADLSPVTGSEQGGIRPVIVIQNDVGNRYSPTVIVSAITSQLEKAKLPTHVEIPSEEYGIRKDSVILLEQVRTLDKRRLKEKTGHVTEENMEKVDNALLISLGLDFREKNNIVKNKENIEIEKNKQLEEKINNIVKDLVYLDGYIMATIDTGKNMSEISTKFIQRNTKICELKSICKQNKLNMSKYYDENIINSNMAYKDIREEVVV